MNGYWITAILAALALACLVVIGMLLPSVAHAQQQQQPCGDRTKIIAYLASKYKEVPRAMAITGGNTFMEIFLSPTGTWTTLITTPNGQTCIVASGEGWEDIAIKPTGTAL